MNTKAGFPFFGISHSEYMLEKSFSFSFCILICPCKYCFVQFLNRFLFQLNFISCFCKWNKSIKYSFLCFSITFSTFFINLKLAFKHTIAKIVVLIFHYFFLLQELMCFSWEFPKVFSVLQLIQLHSDQFYYWFQDSKSMLFRD